MSRKTAWLNLPLFIAVLALIVWWWWRETERQTRPAAGLMGRRRPPARPPQRTYRAPHAVSHVPPAEPVVPAEPELAEEVAPEPEEAAAEAPPAEEPAEKAEAEAEKQNLKRIEGIGPKIESVLHAAGVRSYAQLAESTPAQLQEILDGARIRIADPTTWPEQAALAAAGDWQGLELLQSQLKGGRRVA
jgi:predicted flap endonuclease-1-like 5' DNA nuclease